MQSLHTNHMQMSIIEVFICRRLHMNTSMILICIWLVCRLCTTLHTKCCGAVITHVNMSHDVFHEANVFGEIHLSVKAKGNHSHSIIGCVTFLKIKIDYSTMSNRFFRFIATCKSVIRNMQSILAIYASLICQRLPRFFRFIRF